MKGIVVIIVTSVCLMVDAGGYYRLKKETLCNTTADCGQKYCCRDSNGDIITDEPNGPIDIGLTLRTGYCSKKPGKQGTICIEKCGCEKGYTCYRPVSGVCCLPMRCYDSKWVEEQREYWKKCFADPNCPLPPVAAPGSEPLLK